ncbi:MAG TPA: signal recognition particle-docking protein FtsY [Kofleriaceae bacterium]|jgi:fused signal recognition particle receptor|nr:signal recognition particle-docking protein FtsY [Kofleriaceae bacterium]
MQTELLELAIAIVVIAFILVVLRRASAKSKQRAPVNVREVLGIEPETSAKSKRERKRPRPGAPQAQRPSEPSPTDQAAQPKETPKETPDAEATTAPQAERSAAPADAEARQAYQAGLAKTRGGFVARLGKLFGKKKIDAQTLDELEEVLFTADIGPRAADRIFQAVKSGLSKDELDDASKIWMQIRATSQDILSVDAPPVEMTGKRPFVLLVLGVNGVGKTTTIGKLAQKWKLEGKKVLLAAGDTYRAAATEQLEVWADRAQVPIVRGKPNGDPSSVIFDAIKKGVDEAFDIVICDTAGRLHSNAGLMDELKKVRRVADKAMPGAPHETWMVLDATTGQNAISQAKTFKADMEITGIVLTKLDGSAKGGVVLGICDELKVPVRFVGVGEKIGDLRPFDPAAFVEALYSDATSGEAA